MGLESNPSIVMISQLKRIFTQGKYTQEESHKDNQHNLSNQIITKLHLECAKQSIMKSLGKKTQKNQKQPIVKFC